MSIDKQRVAAVRILDVLGYTWKDGAWQTPCAITAQTRLATAQSRVETLEQAIRGVCGRITGDGVVKLDTSERNYLRELVGEVVS